MTLRVITPPAVEPVTTTTLKSFLRVDGTDDDTLLGYLITAAREKGEEISRRAFITQTLEMILDAWPEDYLLEMLRPPLQSITSVKYLDEDNVEYTWTDYVADARSTVGVLIFNSLPDDSLLESGAIAVRYKAGYGDAAAAVPERIKQAILQLAAHWYEFRETADVPPSIRRMFQSERVVWFR